MWPSSITWATKCSLKTHYCTMHYLLLLKSYYTFPYTTSSCPMLYQMILHCWSDAVNNVPCALCAYWMYCDILTIRDGITLHSEALLIPPTKGRSICIHPQGTLGNSKVSVSSEPHMNADIKCILESCRTCQCFSHSRYTHPLTPTHVPM